MQSQWARILTTTVVGLFQAVPLLAQEAQQPPAAWHSHGAWGFGWIFPLLLLLMVVICVTRFFFFSRRRSDASGYQSWCPSWGPCRPWGDSGASALQILNERFARGEIQKQEYEEKKAAVSSPV